MNNVVSPNRTIRNLRLNQLPLGARIPCKFSIILKSVFKIETST